LSKSKRKGTLAESAVVDYLRRTFSMAERRALQGAKDRGDVSGIPKVVIEIKNHASYKLPEWMRETKVEQANDNAEIGILVIKPNGVGVSNVQDWWSVVPLETMVKLLKDAGYAEGLSSHFDRQ